MSSETLKRELGTFVYAFLRGSNWQLTPDAVSEIALGITEICRENGKPAEITVPTMPIPKVAAVKK